MSSLIIMRIVMNMKNITSSTKTSESIELFDLHIVNCDLWCWCCVRLSDYDYAVAFLRSEVIGFA